MHCLYYALYSIFSLFLISTVNDLEHTNTQLIFSLWIVSLVKLICVINLLNFLIEYFCITVPLLIMVIYVINKQIHLVGVRFILKIHQNNQFFLHCLRFGFYQRPSPEEELMKVSERDRNVNNVRIIFVSPFVLFDLFCVPILLCFPGQLSLPYSFWR